MYWRLTAAEYNQLKGEGNRKAFKKLLGKTTPGILAYSDGVPAGWCAIAPREQYKRLENSKVLKPVDEKKVWSVSCFFIHRQFRKKGLSVPLLFAAVNFAIGQGAAIVEGYPIDPATGPGGKSKKNIPAAFAWTGLTGTFSLAGFKEVARRSETRPIMRFIKK